MADALVPSSDGQRTKRRIADGASVFRPSKAKLAIWASVSVGIGAVCAVFAVAGPDTTYSPVYEPLRVAAWVLLVAIGLVVAACLAVGGGALVVDDEGVERQAVLPWDRRRWVWGDWSRGEVRATVFGPVLVFYRRGGKKDRPSPAFAAATTVERMAAAAELHVPVSHRPARGRAWRPPQTVVVLLLVALLAIPVLVLPEGRILREGPGVALHVQQRVTAPAALIHAPRGDILSLSVSVGPTSLLQFLRDHGDRAVGWTDADAAYRHQSPQASALEDKLDNRQAKAAATYIALRRLGYPVTLSGGQPVVDYSPPGSPLHHGDLVDAIDATPTPYRESLYAALDGRQTGTQVQVTVTEAGGARSQRSVTLGHSGYVPTLPSLGGATFTTVPLKVGGVPEGLSLDTDHEGGPSAGLALTLGLLDTIGPTPIMGAHPVRLAVTGTIAPDGTVGPIGGLQQKVALAERSGATLLIVPLTEKPKAQYFASTQLKVAGVTTLDEALAVLAAKTSR